MQSESTSGATAMPSGAAQALATAAAGGEADRAAGAQGWRAVAVTAVLVVAADWLLFDRPVGVSAVLFLVLLAAGGLVARPGQAQPGALAVAGGLLLAALVPVLIGPTPLSVAIAGVATAHFALAAGGFTSPDLAARCIAVLQLLGQVFWRVPVDGINAIAAAGDRPRRGGRGGRLAAWVVPLGLGLVFLLLFRSANPMIRDWIGELELSSFLRRIGPVRVLFWAATFALVWPFVVVRVRRWVRRPTVRSAAAPGSFHATPDTVGAEQGGAATPAVDWQQHVLGRAAVLRSLIMFNVLFAVQTGLDLAYLWGGAALPEGMTLAAYAHRGAYPLIATALLAAAFVLVAMRPGGPAEDSRPIRILVFLWLAQNVLLVVSSMLRLDLYVAVYTLTHLRVAAFVWMLLVAIGLVLIVARIVLARSNAWLVGANLVSLTATLWLCGFLNVPALIAAYNVEHSREMGGEGQPLDVPYLVYDLGAQALPALDRFIEHLPEEARGEYQSARQTMIARFVYTWRDWRSWNYRDWTLAEYLRERHPELLPAWAADAVDPAPGSPRESS